MGPSIETLRAAVDEVAVHLAAPATAYAPPNLAEVESALAAIEQRMEEMRARGETRDLSMDDIIRLMAFDFALGQLRLNLRDIAERAPVLAALAGSALPLIRRLQAIPARWK